MEYVPLSKQVNTVKKVSKSSCDKKTAPKKAAPAKAKAKPAVKKPKK